jgi:hypothetical protein
VVTTPNPASRSQAGGALAWFTPVAVALAVIGVSHARTGSPLFVAAMVVAAAGYVHAARRLMLGAPVALSMAVLGVTLGTVARLPLLALDDAVVARDAIRYVWDARVQRAGLDPYRVRPDAPEVALLHSPLTRDVNAAWLPTIYPPVAQLFFRGVTRVSESLRAFRLTAIASDAVVALALVGLLRQTQRPLTWAVIYAWHPVMMFESATGGHLDFFGAALVVLAAWAFAAARPTTGAVLYVAAVLVKPLPLVLAPLVVFEARWRDWLLALALGLGALVAITGGAPPVGSMGAFVDFFRFNGPIFRALTVVLPPRVVTAGVIVAGLAVGAWLSHHRRRAPEAWAWPMAVALVCAPVVYPWYFAWFVPFLPATRTWPLQAWSLTVIAVYPAWEIAVGGGPFRVPAPLLFLEFGGPLAAWGVWRALTRRRSGA